MKNKNAFPLLSAVCLAAISFPAITTADTISGTFTFDKRPPAAAIVYVKDGTPAELSEIVVNQVNKEFAQPIAIAPKGTTVIFRNSDTIQHNVFGTSTEANVSFDSGLVDPDSDVLQEVTWEEGEFVTVGCRIHPKMRIWIGSVTTSNYTILPIDREQEVSFKIEGVPASASEVVVWFPRYDPIEISLSGSNSSTHELTYKAKPIGSLAISRSN